jgi:hypothetical protein
MMPARGKFRFENVKTVGLMRLIVGNIAGA